MQCAGCGLSLHKKDRVCGNCGMRVGSSRRAMPTDTSRDTRPMRGGVVGAAPEFAASAPPPVVNAPVPPADVASARSETAAGTPVSMETIAPPIAAAPVEAPAVDVGGELAEETVFTPRRPAGSRWRLTLASGEEVDVSTRAVAGRKPKPPAGWEGATLVTIDDPDRTVSKTHAGFAVEGDGVFVTDLDSTNGVAIVSPDGTEIVLERGRAVPVPEGADVELGSFAVRITRA